MSRARAQDVALQRRVTPVCVDGVLTLRRWRQALDLRELRIRRQA